MQGDTSSVQVFLTRPAERNGSVPGRLRAAGMQVFELPALELRPLPCSHLPSPRSYDLIVFVSRYAAQRFLQVWAGRENASFRWPDGTLAATVGASSANTLKHAGISPNCIVHPPADEPAQDSEALLSVLDARNAELHRVLIVRGSSGREWLATTLRQRGVTVDVLPVYERVPAAWSADTISSLQLALDQHPGQCVFLLTSSEGVRALAGKITDLGLLEAWSQSSFLAIHERIGATLQSVIASQRTGYVPRLTLCTPDDDAIVDAIHAVAGPTAKP